MNPALSPLGFGPRLRVPDDMLTCHPFLGRLTLPFGLFPPLSTRLTEPCRAVHPSVTNKTLGALGVFPPTFESSAFSPAKSARPWSLQYGPCMALVPTPGSLSLGDGVSSPLWNAVQSRHGQNISRDASSVSPRLRSTPSPAEEQIDTADLRDLEQFAANFKSRRIKLGFTQTNVGEL